MEPDLPETHPNGDMSTLVDAPDGSRYRIRVQMVKPDHVIRLPLRGFRGLLLKLLLRAEDASRPPDHRDFTAFVEPADGGLPVRAKMLAARTTQDALLQCARLLSERGLVEFDQIHASYGG